MLLPLNQVEPCCRIWRCFPFHPVSNQSVPSVCTSPSKDSPQPPLLYSCPISWVWLYPFTPVLLEKALDQPPGTLNFPWPSHLLSAPGGGPAPQLVTEAPLSPGPLASFIIFSRPEEHQDKLRKLEHERGEGGSLWTSKWRSVWVEEWISHNSLKRHFHSFWILNSAC